MKRRAWLTFLVILAVFAVEAAVLWFYRPIAAPPIVTAPVALPASVQALQGEVEASPADRDEWRRISSGDLLGEGERLRTGEDGKVEFSLGERCRIVLGPKAQIRLTSLDDPDTGATTGIRLDLDRGASLVTVGRLARRERFHIVTPTAVCGVRGTKFLVTVEDANASP